MSAGFKTRVLRELASQFPGFKFAEDRLVRKEGSFVQVITAHLPRSSDALTIQPLLAVRVETLENIFECAGAIGQEFAGVALTLTSDARFLQGHRGFLMVPLSTSIADVAAACLAAVRPQYDSYFAARRTLKQIDTLVNDMPQAQLLDIRTPERRAWTGIAAAWLTDRPAFDNLAAGYRAKLETLSNGFYLGGFGRVEAYLRAHPELRGRPT
jgi:hypothetical protein